MQKTLKFVGGREEAGLSKGIGFVEMFFNQILENQGDPNCTRVPSGVKLEMIERKEVDRTR